MAHDFNQRDIEEHLTTVYKEELEFLEEESRKNGKSIEVVKDETPKEASVSIVHSVEVKKDGEINVAEKKIAAPVTETTAISNNNEKVENPDHFIPVKTKKTTTTGCKCVII